MATLPCHRTSKGRRRAGTLCWTIAADPACPIPRFNARRTTSRRCRRWRRRRRRRARPIPCAARAVTHRIGKLVATGVVRRVGRRIAGTRLARASVRAGTGPGAAARVLNLHPPLPIDGPDPLAAAATGDARWGRCRGGWGTIRMGDVAGVLGAPLGIGALAPAAAIRGLDAPEERAAEADDGLPLAAAAGRPRVLTAAVGALRRGRDRVAGVSRRVGIQRGCCALLGCGRAAERIRWLRPLLDAIGRGVQTVAPAAELGRRTLAAHAAIASL